MVNTDIYAPKIEEWLDRFFKDVALDCICIVRIGSYSESRSAV